MITEDYVSFEVAKLLKEKGFDVYGDGSFGSETEIHREYSPSGKIKALYNSKPHKDGYPAPTLQMARKWIRLSYKIHIRILEDTLGTVYEWQIYKNGFCQKHSFIEDSYEKSLETAIKYCLTNLI